MSVRDRSTKPIILILMVLATLFAADGSAGTNIEAAYAKLPLGFERNQGQAAAEVEYLSRGRNATLFLTGNEAVLTLRRDRAKPAVLRMRLAGANSQAKAAAEEPLQGKVNYLLGNDRTQWHIGVTTYRRVRYSEVWPGIDLVWHGTRSALEYDFIVQPGSDPARIRVAFDGTERLRLDRDGNLIAKTAAGEVLQSAPVVYQDGPQGRTQISGKYALKSRRVIGFEIGPYDRSRPLVIDPVLNYSTYLGGVGADEAFAIAVDKDGQAYVTGTADTGAKDFPGTDSGFNKTFGDVAVFVTKLNAAGTAPIYTALIGSGPDSTRNCGGTGGFCDVISNGIAITADGKAAITGGIDNYYGDSEYPTTANAFQGGGVSCAFAYCTGMPSRYLDVFVTMLNAAGDGLIYSTFYAGRGYREGEGSEVAQALALDSDQRIYITGFTTSDGLATRNEFQNGSAFRRQDAFIAVFDPFITKGNDTLIYASYLGGREDDTGLGISVDASRNAYVGGSTRSTDLQTKSPAGQSLPPLQATFQGGQFDGFVAKIDTKVRGEASLTYLTYFGGNVNDRVEGIAVDSAQRAYITGASNSSPATFPLLNAFDATQFNGEAFVAKLNADGTARFYCSFLGGENGNGAGDGEEGLAIAIDAGENVYVTGRTTSGASFPNGPFAPVFAEEQQGTAFVAKIDATVSATTPARLLYATTFGGRNAKAHGIAVDPKGNVYLAGTTGGEFPTTNGALQTVFGGDTDAFVAKIGQTLSDTTGLYRVATHEFFLRNSNTSGGADLTVVFGNDRLPVAGDWDGNGVTDVGVLQANGDFLLRFDANTTVIQQFFQTPPENLPVAGDFDGDGFDTIGTYRTTGSQPGFLLSNSHAVESVVAKPNILFFFGKQGDLPIAGDWNGDGLDTVGVYRPSTSEFFLVNDFLGGEVITFKFGVPGDLPIAGDWNGDGVDGVGVYRKSDSSMRLTNDFGVTEQRFRFTEEGDLPIAGNWDGK
ncbi:MAG TPA: SBBP repeat-containing protein [Thermoanaerobaculia bacterium]|nr:SBBP repeat-containing protein [Thermoanaerobaculia bacterium]